MGILQHTHLPFFLLILLLIFLFNDFSQAMSTITEMNKDQVACTMCSSCDNPCQPIIFPPPPSLPPPSSPPPASGSNCPPPPSQPSDGGVYYYSPPPPAQQSDNYSPPSGGADYPPTNPYGNPIPLPPNPIVPYFPYYYYSPPQPSAHSDSNSVQLKSHSLVSSLIILLASLFLI